MSRVTLLLLALIGLMVGSADAQFLILKDGSRIPSSEFHVENGKIIRTILLGDNKTATTELPKQNVGSLDWPEVTEITEARDLMAKGKADEALALLSKAKATFELFETLPGSPYADVFFTYVEMLSQAGKFEDTVKLIPQLKILKLTDAQKMQLRIIQLDIDRQTSSEFTSIIAEAESILSETDDSSVGASIWAMIADIYARQKEWEKALMAYLRIPVFYGTQLQRVPDAELKAGQMLARMKRYEDAQAVFKRLTESYTGSAVADLAAKELAKINGMKNEPEAGDAKPTANDAAKHTEAAQTAAPPDAAAAPAK
jgi:tetratricopeptide (TPR) repeat protein